MVCNVNDGVHRPVSNPSTGFGRHHIGIIAAVNFDIDIESGAKSSDFHVVAVGTSTSHLSQVALKCSIDFLWGSGNMGKECGESTGILPLRISSRSPSRVNFDELLIVITMYSHIIDRPRTQLAMLRLVSIKLIREGIEETVAYSVDT